MGHCSPRSTTTWTSRTRTYSYCAARTARSLPPSALRGPRGRVSWRPPRKTTGGCSRRTRSAWDFWKPATERGALRAAVGEAPCVIRSGHPPSVPAGSSPRRYFQLVPHPERGDGIVELSPELPIYGVLRSSLQQSEDVPLGGCDSPARLRRGALPGAERRRVVFRLAEAMARRRHAVREVAAQLSGGRGHRGAHAVARHSALREGAGC